MPNMTRLGCSATAGIPNERLRVNGTSQTCVIRFGKAGKDPSVGVCRHDALRDETSLGVSVVGAHYTENAASRSELTGGFRSWSQGGNMGSNSTFQTRSEAVRQYRRQLRKMRTSEQRRKFVGRLHVREGRLKRKPTTSYFSCPRSNFCTKQLGSDVGSVIPWV
jgi:hypothetical protein